MNLKEPLMINGDGYITNCKLVEYYIVYDTSSNLESQHKFCPLIFKDIGQLHDYLLSEEYEAYVDMLDPPHKIVLDRIQVMEPA